MKGEPDRDLVARLRNLRPALEARGITHLALFGSRARGTERPDSDVDLLVEVAPGARFSLIDLVGAEQHIARETRLAVSLVMRRSLAPAFRANVADQVIELF